MLLCKAYGLSLDFFRLVILNAEKGPLFVRQSGNAPVKIAFDSLYQAALSSLLNAAFMCSTTNAGGMRYLSIDWLLNIGGRALRDEQEGKS